MVGLSPDLEDRIVPISRNGISCWAPIDGKSPNWIASSFAHSGTPSSVVELVIRESQCARSFDFRGRIENVNRENRNDALERHIAIDQSAVFAFWWRTSWSEFHWSYPATDIHDGFELRWWISALLSIFSSLLFSSPLSFAESSGGGLAMRSHENLVHIHESHVLSSLIFSLI